MLNHRLVRTLRVTQPSRYLMRNYNQLITDLDEWDAHNGCKIGADGWLQAMGTFNLAVAFTSLFWPEFTEHQNSVFIAPFEEGHIENYERGLIATEGNVTSVEATLNHQHILDIFPNAETEPSREQVLFLGKVLKEMWGAKLKQDFPSRKFVVSFPEDYSDNLIDYEITFWEVRERNVDSQHKS